ncbi:MAG: 4-(cytidine 5'-diphospho)-2-C-methyl-D-erythritol kinase [Candidatus Omnitrophica bacterium]|jgi:4-diphosphocytidyl-2-C-methyl-D-erythritol kinase|nr:4-(cytidine 5'-diphospho)-2-C-methyl-D-erythritol kinase [Candidatus Omnitrophota bacterium]
MKHFRSPLVIKSFAKVNLYLQVLNKRKDNFHNLKTLFARISLADTVILKNAEGKAIGIKCDNPQVPQNKTNLCWRAAELLRRSQGLSFGLKIEIKKRIPVGAGLGGGSANAASVLSGLNKYWNLNLSKTKLLNLAAQLGSDIPFFIQDTKFALGSSRGDKIKPVASLQRLKLWFILIYPNIKVSTPLVYEKFDSFSGLTTPLANVKILISELSRKGFRVPPEYLFNSLEPVTTRLYPVVNQVKNAFYGIGLEQVMMSGSGAAVFALCSSQKQAQGLSRKLRKKHKSWQIFVTSLA